MRGPLLKTALQSLIVIGGLGAATLLTGFVEARRPALPDDYSDSDLTVSASRLRGFTLGMDGLVADWYYMRALQYIGDKVVNSKSDFINIEDLRDLNPRLLYPLLDNATDLDPHFVEAYLYGAILLPAINAENAIAIAQKGVANNPDEYRLYRQLGYTYWRLGQYDKAAETYERGAAATNAPPFMEMMAAVMRTKGGSRETARAIYREMLASTDDESVKLTASRRLQQMDSLDEREAIDNALAEFKDANGRCPSSYAEILPKLANVKLPEGHEFRIDRSQNIVDPTDAPYLLDQDKCRSKLDLSKTSIAEQ